MVVCMLRHHRPSVGALGDLCSLENDRGESQGQLRNGGPRLHPLDEGAEDLDPICCPGLWTSSKRELLGTFTCSALASHLGAMILPIGLPAGLPEGWVLHTASARPFPSLATASPAPEGAGPGDLGDLGDLRDLGPGRTQASVPWECGMWVAQGHGAGSFSTSQWPSPECCSTSPPRPSQGRPPAHWSSAPHLLLRRGLLLPHPKRETGAFSGLCPAFVSGPECHLPASWRRGFRNHRARHAGGWNPERADDIPKATQRGGRLPTLRRAPCPACPPHCPLHRAQSRERRCESPPHQPGSRLP